MKQPLHFTAPDTAGKTVWATTLSHAGWGYNVEARIGASRWTGSTMRSGSRFVLVDSDEAEVGTFRTLRDVALRAAFLARKAELRRLAGRRLTPADPCIECEGTTLHTSGCPLRGSIDRPEKEPVR